MITRYKQKITDIFLSYAKEDRPTVRKIVLALEAQGWNVFWDRRIPAGKTWRDVIEANIERSHCIAVVWSRASIGSYWVLEEAEIGRRRGNLIPILIDDVAPPLGFKTLQAADLSKWDGNTTLPVFRSLISDFAALLGPPPAGEQNHRKTGDKGNLSYPSGKETPAEQSAPSSVMSGDTPKSVVNREDVSAKAVDVSHPKMPESPVTPTATPVATGKTHRFVSRKQVIIVLSVFAFMLLSIVVLLVYSKRSTERGSSRDICDLKFFFRYYRLQIAVDIFNNNNKLINSSEKKERELAVAVLFNKRRKLVNELNSKNTFFHFIDFTTGRYFGYRLDENKNPQPEFRQYDNLGPKEDLDGKIYWGAYEEFVRPLKWLDPQKVMDLPDTHYIELLVLEQLNERFTNFDTLRGEDQISEGKLSWLRDYRIAYVNYPQSAIDKIHDFLPSSSIGVAVMVGIDRDKDGLYVLAKDDGVDMPENVEPTDIVMLDDNDDFFYSNHVRLEVIPVNVVLDAFQLCSDSLTLKHKRVLNSVVIPRLLTFLDQSVLLVGYADATPVKCRKFFDNTVQQDMAKARAESVKKYLIEHGVEEIRIATVGAGIRLPGRVFSPEDRSVVVKFVR